MKEWMGAVQVERCKAMNQTFTKGETSAVYSLYTKAVDFFEESSLDVRPMNYKMHEHSPYSDTQARNINTHSCTKSIHI